MSYLVMEVHPAYAVVLDQEGRFLKAANLHYQVGERVEQIVPLRETQGRAGRSPLIRPLMGLCGLAACFCAVFFGYYQPNFSVYGTLRIQINPDVEMTVSRTDRVLDLVGLNPDGADLIEGYDYRGKVREEATGELVERAIDMGYLSDGDTVSITVSSRDAAWQAREEEAVQAQLEDRYGETIVIRLGGEEESAPPPSSTVQPPAQEASVPTYEAVVTIPPPPPSSPSPTVTVTPSVPPASQPPREPSPDPVWSGDDDDLDDLPPAESWGHVPAAEAGEEDDDREEGAPEDILEDIPEDSGWDDDSDDNDDDGNGDDDDDGDDDAGGGDDDDDGGGDDDDDDDD